MGDGFEIRRSRHLRNVNLVFVLHRTKSTHGQPAQRLCLGAFYAVIGLVVRAVDSDWCIHSSSNPSDGCLPRMAMVLVVGPRSKVRGIEVQQAAATRLRRFERTDRGLQTPPTLRFPHVTTRPHLSSGAASNQHTVMLMGLSGFNLLKRKNRASASTRPASHGPSISSTPSICASPG
ncbi:hypothetical protein B0T17DRAFT_512556 [Bombardia bombarda]|uniref:Uncharacterized protein n=1 Tax=Bombardia bombarda TaxID=252184 RepID=A0AA39T0N9_9PEZI|nr:hypothetical protein B0T17DRAFT_512556 [Bombardia bombarda]